MSEKTTPAAEQATAVEVLDRNTPPTPDEIPALGLTPSRNYMQAVELGHVAAASGLYPDARTAARAAMVIMVGMDLGIPPAASLMGIHIMESSDGKVHFLIEGKLLGSLINEREGYAYKVLSTSEEACELEFLRNGEPAGPNITWDKAKAVKAGLWNKKGPWQNYPAEMLRWRALAEGTRIYFPEVLSGQSIYVEGEFGESDTNYRQALEGPQAPPALADEEAETLRKEADEIFAEIVALNPDRLLRGRKARMIKQAEHSHAALRDVVGSLEDLRDTEAVYQERLADLTEVAGEKPAKEVAARAERRGSQRERIEVVEKALTTAREAADKGASGEEETS